VLSLLAAEERSDLRIEGVDISPPAVAGANRLLAVSGHESRIHFRVKDISQMEAQETDGRCQGIISAMKAEHLSDPRPLFGSLSRRISADGLIFSARLLNHLRESCVRIQAGEPAAADGRVPGLRVTRLMSDASTVAAGSRFLSRATAMILRPHLNCLGKTC
jgi:cyclopropane fatty-acyl-phospholipid synthase-like methyltransferase